MSIKRDYIPERTEKFWLLNTDTTSLLRPYSKCLPSRGFVYKPNNQVAGNKPVDVGYECSTVGLSARSGLGSFSGPPWNLPLSMRLVPFEENRNEFTASQVNDLLNNKELPFHNSLTVNALDSNYASPEYIVDTDGQQNLVNIIRMRSNRNVWGKLSSQEQSERRKNNKSNRGADAVYGTQYKLSDCSEWDIDPDQQNEMEIELSNGKSRILRICIWEDMMLRSKRGKNMKDKVFRLVRVELLDPQTREPVFKKPMWLSVWGKRSKELSTDEIYRAYRNRFDIEHFFRFGKQRLLLDSFQTPDEQHFQNWPEVVSLAYWLLWIASDEASHVAEKKWQKYDKNFKKRTEHGLRVSPSKVQQQLEAIILGFEQKPFLPKVKIKGKGRKIGTKMLKRKVYPIRRKPKKTPKTKPKAKKPGD